MLQKIVITVVIVALGFLGYQFFIKSLLPESKAVELLKNLEQTTNIGFSKAEAADFEWYLATDSGVIGEDISGSQVEAKDVSNEQLNSLKAFFTGNGFEIDEYNISAGTVSGLIGYQKDSLVCIVLSGIAGDQADQHEVIVKCGLSELGQPQVPVETAVKQLLAEKYDRKAAEVTIAVTQQEGDFVKGSVSFQPGGAENSGMFLAVRTNNQWKLAFDGNGAISCSAVDPYGFPTTLIEECVDEETQKPKDRIEAACLSSGGQVKISLCCKSTQEFPNLCLIGPCGCSPESSKQLKICECGEGECFNGQECVEINL